ncbi:MAG TPA: hypothetical protein P5337_03130 [Aestuariivirga sp.]|nr:hypothetical protein [Aestuariivirga sp.]
MRSLLMFSLICLTPTVATAAAANCAAEIGGLLNGGAWDPFVQENRRETTVLRHADGTETPISDVLWDGPYKSINCTPYGCFMAIGNASWTGSSFEGPWTRSNDTGTVEPEEFVRATRDRLAASIAEPECPGATELDGEQALLYRFFSKPEPNEYGSWWGGRFSVWLTQDAKRLMRIEVADGIASWAPEPSREVQVTTVVYDDTIRIEEPK